MKFNSVLKNASRNCWRNQRKTTFL